MKNVAIIDYNMGNLFSVKQACINVNLQPIITSDSTVIEEADAVILPGVGAFPEAMNNLHEMDLVDIIVSAIKKKPFMGICLGYQLLFCESEEFGRTKGLGIFDGIVKKFKFINKTKNLIKIPQIGWNRISPSDETKWNHSLLEDISFHEFMYFVHSFYVETADKNIILTYSNYEGLEYCSSIEHENIFASQFHPEKSGKEGIKIYQKFSKKIMSK